MKQNRTIVWSLLCSADKALSCPRWFYEKRVVLVRRCNCLIFPISQCRKVSLKNFKSLTIFYLQVRPARRPGPAAPPRKIRSWNLSKVQEIHSGTLILYRALCVVSLYLSDRPRICAWEKYIWQSGKTLQFLNFDKQWVLGLIKLMCFKRKRKNKHK